jgi:Fe(3+) dicitrate transport protein
MNSLRFVLAGVLAGAVAGNVQADAAESSRPATGSLPSGMEQVMVIGSRENAALVGGSAAFLSAADLEQFRHTDVLRVLKQVPGLYLVEEEGYGLRPNIGIRGSGTDRSARITLMEDGVLIAPAPYAAPAAYYFPTMQRMQAVEILKGSSSVRFGPRSTGGAVNLVSTPIPSGPLTGQADLAYGQNSTLLGYLTAGGSGEHWGFMVEALRQQTDGFKELDGGGDTGYTLDDYLAKLRYTTDSDARYYQELELKLGTTSQDDDETYMGLTDEDFSRTPFRRYSASQRDNFTSDHDQYELRHFIELGSSLSLASTVYRNEFSRNWYKVDRVGGLDMATILEDPETFADQYSWMTGATSPDDAIRLRNNNRDYYGQGIQTVLSWSPSTDGRLSHDVQFGLRWHEDEEDRFQDDDGYRMQDGRLVLTSDGAPGSQDNRVSEAQAFAAYLQDELSFGSWIVTPGLRFESIDLVRRDYSRSDPDRSEGPTRVRRSEVDELIPGLSAVYLVDETLRIVGGVHKGFNPPAPGSSSDPEESVNYELGLRYEAASVSGEVIAFFNDYTNLVGTCTASTGGNCDIGEQFDGGEADMKGLELALGYEASAGGVSLPIRFSYTYTDATFRNSFSSGFEEWGDVESGDRLPYIPEHQLQLTAGTRGDRWGLNLSASWVDEMRTVAGQGPTPASELTDAHWVLDFSGDYELTRNISIYARAENLLDETYVAARRPAGARPGLPRTAFAGLTARF